MASNTKDITKIIAHKTVPLLVKQRSTAAVNATVNTVTTMPRVALLHLPTPSIDLILADPSARKAFSKFASDTHITENEKFIVEIRRIEEALASKKKPTQSLEKLEKEQWAQQEFQDIYFRFIAESSSQWISISAKMRKILFEQNNGNSMAAPKPTSFRFATFKEIYEDIVKDLSGTTGPLAQFHSKYSSMRNLHQSAATGATFAPAPATAISLATPVPMIATTVAAATASSTEAAASASTGTATPSLHFHYNQPAHLTVIKPTNSRSGSSSLLQDAHLVTARNIHPTMDTQRGTPAKYSPLMNSAATPTLHLTDITEKLSNASTNTPTIAITVPSAAANPTHSLEYKNAIMGLSKRLGEYLVSIPNYNNEETGCTYCCFRNCKKDKSGIYKNINDLVAHLQLSLQNWSDDKVETMKKEISDALQCHQMLAGKEEQQIIESLRTALGLLSQYKPNRHHL